MTHFLLLSANRHSEVHPMLRSGLCLLCPHQDWSQDLRPCDARKASASPPPTSTSSVDCFHHSSVTATAPSAFASGRSILITLPEPLTCPSTAHLRGRHCPSSIHYGDAL